MTCPICGEELTVQGNAYACWNTGHEAHGSLMSLAHGGSIGIIFLPDDRGGDQRHEARARALGRTA